MVNKFFIYTVLLLVFFNIDIFGLNAITTNDEINLKLKFLNEKIDLKFESLNKRIDDVNKRIDDMNNRISSLESRMNTQFSVIIILIAAILGFIIWDRISMMKPIIKRIEKVENELEINSKDGSKFYRLLESLRKMAKSDKKLAAILRSFHLL